ncbi:hypothetical protein [Rhodobacter sp. NSM]|uniref:hypothetical protein n=1 Tax=Rhodobacter sp. NSM TaxID=3457501 RepID=UPI003FD4FEBA
MTEDDIERGRRIKKSAEVIAGLYKRFFIIEEYRNFRTRVIKVLSSTRPTSPSAPRNRTERPF